MNDQRLRGLELSQLHTLHALLLTGSVTAAARKLETSQPAVSRTLARLREVFGDPLFRPVGRSLQRTPLADQLLPRIEQALSSLDRLFERPTDPAQPAQAERVVTIAASDLATAVIVTPWLRWLRAAAPGIVVRVVPVSPASMNPLAHESLDLAIAPRLPIDGIEQFVFRELTRDQLVCVVRAGHPRARARLSLDEYLRLEHLVVSNARNNVSPVDLALYQLGKARRVVASVPTFLSALHLVAATNCAAALPAQLVKAARVKLVARKLPLVLDASALHLVWHPRRTLDPFHRWLRAGLAAAAAGSPLSNKQPVQQALPGGNSGSIFVT